MTPFVFRPGILLIWVFCLGFAAACEDAAGTAGDGGEGTDDGGTSGAGEGSEGAEGPAGEGGEGGPVGPGPGNSGDAPGPQKSGDCYTEEFHPDADVADLEAAFDPADWKTAAFGVMERRLPPAYTVLNHVKDDPRLAAWMFDTSSFQGVMSTLNIATHEGLHVFTAYNFDGTTRQFMINNTLTISYPEPQTFRMGDVSALIESDAPATYEETYLLDPAMGDQGFETLMDELNAYIMTAATDAMIYDLLQEGVIISSRDGALAFWYFTELYLRLARTEHPDVYAALQGDANIRALVRTQWLRFQYVLQFSGLHPELGINDQAIGELVYNPENQKEIEDFLGQKLEASNCLP